jgi:hypothetical protein
VCRHPARAQRHLHTYACMLLTASAVPHH